MTASEIKAAFPGYAGWNDEASIVADFNATGGAGKGGSSSGGGSSVDSILNSAISAITALVPKAVKPYDEVNPFSFDEVLAQQAATQQYSPYYNEMLSDYVTKVEKTKSRSELDFKRTLEELDAGKEYYMGTQRRLLDKALRNVDEGYAGRGLFFSGARPKDIGELQTEYKAQNENYTQNYMTNKTGAELSKQRTLEDVDLDQKNYTRDIEREKQAAIQSGVVQRKTEAIDEYNAGRQKYYDAAQYSGLTSAYA